MSENLQLIDSVSPDTVVESSLIDVDRDIKEISLIDKQLTNSTIVNNTLRSTEGALIVAMEEGGLDVHSANLLDQVIQSIENSKVTATDYQSEDSVIKNVPSVEHYVFMREKSLNTKVALESIKSSIQSFWRWLIERLKSLAKSLRSFYNSNTLLLDHLERRIDRVQRYLNGIGRSNTRLYFNNLSIANGLSVNGKFPENLTTHVYNLRSVTGDILDWRNERSLNKIVDTLKTAVNNPFADLIGVINEINYFPGCFKSTNRVYENTVRNETIDLFGNRKIVFNSIANLNSKPIDSMVGLIGRVSSRIEYIEPTREPSEKVPVVSITDLQNVISQCKLIVKELKEYKNQIPKLEQLVNNLTSFVSTQVNKKVDESETKNQRARLIENISIVVPKIIYSPTLQYCSYCANVVRLLTSYVEICARTTKNER